MSPLDVKLILDALNRRFDESDARFDRLFARLQQPAHGCSPSCDDDSGAEPVDALVTTTYSDEPLDAVQEVAIALPRGSKSSSLGSMREFDLACPEQLAVDAAASACTITETTDVADISLELAVPPHLTAELVQRGPVDVECTVANSYIPASVTPRPATSSASVAPALASSTVCNDSVVDRLKCACEVDMRAATLSAAAVAVPDPHAALMEADSDILVNAAFLDAVPSVGCVVTMAAEVVHIDPTECARCGIFISGTGENFSIDAADLLVGVLRRAATADHHVRAELWPPQGNNQAALDPPLDTP